MRTWAVLHHRHPIGYSDLPCGWGVGDAGVGGTHVSQTPPRVQ